MVLQHFVSSLLLRQKNAVEEKEYYEFAKNIFLIRQVGSRYYVLCYLIQCRSHLFSEKGHA